MGPKEKIVLTMANVLVRNTSVDPIVMNARLVTAWMVSQHVRSVFFSFLCPCAKLLPYSKYIVLHENCKKWDANWMYLFQELNIMELGFSKDKFIQFPTGQVPLGNESLAEPVPWYWVPGRDILRHHSFKLQSLQKNIFLTFLPIWKKLVKSIEYEHH